jgi:hypothetical protein
MQRIGFIIIELHGNYSVEQFMQQIAPWSFSTLTRKDDRRLKMIVAYRELGQNRSGQRDGIRSEVFT